MFTVIKPLSAEQFREYEVELVGKEIRMHARLAALLGTSEIGVKRYATEARPIPDYIAQSLRALVLLKRRKQLKMLPTLD